MRPHNGSDDVTPMRPGAGMCFVHGIRTMDGFEVSQIMDAAPCTMQCALLPQSRLGWCHGVMVLGYRLWRGLM